MSKTSNAARDESARANSVEVVAPKYQGLPAQLKLLAIPLVVALVWWSILGGMAGLFSNPTTINLVQLRHRDRLVRIQSDDPASNVAFITAYRNEDWVTQDPEEVTIENLAESDVNSDGEWIVPLSFVDGDNRVYAITTFSMGKKDVNNEPVRSPPFAYPFNDETNRLLEAALEKIPGRR